MMRSRSVWLIAVSVVLFFAVPFLCACAEESGETLGASVSGVVWIESTVDGKRINEGGLAKATVTLERIVGGTTETVASVTTPNNKGEYAFGGLPEGEYCLSVSLPNGYQFTKHGEGSATLPASGRESVTPNFVLADGEILTLDIGTLKNAGRVKLVAFEDLNANGGRMNSEPLVRGVQVSLMYDYNGASYVIATETTNGLGETSFEALSPSVYYLSVLLPDNYLPGPLGVKTGAYYNCLLPSKTNRCVSAPFDLKAKVTESYSLGMVKTGAVSGRVWYDGDCDGVMSASDGGCAKAQVTLRSDAMQLSYDIDLNADGSFRVDHVMPGAYQLSVVLPDHMMFAMGDSAITLAAREGSLPVTVTASGDTIIPAVGAMPLTSFALTFYYDKDRNGVLDGLDTAYAGASVALYKDGALIGERVSAVNGVALFDTVRGGTCEIVCTLAQGDVFVTSGESALNTPRALSAATFSVQIPDGMQTGVNLGVTQPAMISGLLFMSADNSGVYKTGDDALRGFVVQAINEDGEVAAETITDEDGAYLLTVPPAAHKVRFLFVDPYIAAPFAFGDNAIEHHTQDSGDTTYYDLSPMQTVADVRGALFAAGVVDGYVRLSLAGREILGGCEGVYVTLLDEYGAPVSDFAFDVTDQDGYFTVKGVLPGDYSLSYSLPYTLAFTSPMTDQSEIEGQPFSVEANGKVRVANVCAIRTGEMRGHIYHMIDGNTLMPLEGRISVSSAQYETLYETRAMDDGEYVLYGLRPGEYTLTVELPDGFIVNQSPLMPLSGAHSGVASADFTIALDENLLDADVLASLPASFGGVMYFDRDCSYDRNDSDKPIVGHIVTLSRGEDVYTLMTDETGAFAVDNLLPGEYLITTTLDADCVILSGDAAREENTWTQTIALPDGGDAHMEIGVLRYAELSGHIWNMDGTSQGVDGLTVKLLDADNTLVASAVSDEDGFFLFNYLYPGEYTVDTVPPAGCLFARAVDTTARASLILNDVSGKKENVKFTLSMGEKRAQCDIGIGAIGGIGDLAWLDTDGNGMQDMGEPCMPGVKISLYQYGELVAQTETDEYGRYILENLYPGLYNMVVEMHGELKPTLHRTDFPLVASILPEESGTTVTVENVVVTSGGINRNCDLGFVLRKKNVYPAAMKLTPPTDWRPYSDRPAQSE